MSDKKLRISIAVVSVVGIAISIYLIYVHYAKIAPICTGSGGCEKVQSSVYATFLGVPVATIGLIGDLAILASTFSRSSISRYAGFLLALIGFGFSLYLTYLELFEIKAICQWCVAHAVVILILLVLTGVRFFREPGDELVT